jgi:hypothetical protein
VTTVVSEGGRVHLRLATAAPQEQADSRRVTWDIRVEDNEGMGKRSSKSEWVLLDQCSILLRGAAECAIGPRRATSFKYCAGELKAPASSPAARFCRMLRVPQAAALR